MRASSYTRFVVGPLVMAVSLAVAVPTVSADDKKQAEKLEQAQRLEAQTLVVLVDDLASGKPAPSALAFKWEQNHFIKAQAEKTYVPFTLAFDPGAVTTPGVGVYLRVMKKGAAPEPPPAEPKKKDKDKAGDRREVALSVRGPVLHRPADPGAGPAAAAAPRVRGRARRVRRLRRREGACRGRGRAGGAARAPPALKSGIIKYALTVPDLASEFTTSSIIVADKVDVLQAPLPNDQQATNPYTFGQMKITPAGEHVFSKKNELSIVFWIYGAGSDATTKKPDVNIDFKFNKKNGDAFEYFNKTEPQALNAETLPPQFDLAAGHQLPGSLAVPLASFPEGDYRLDIELNDKTSGKTLKRDVTFTVVP